LSPVVYYIHTDQLGTPQKMTDGSANIVWDNVSDPFGNAVATQGTSWDAANWGSFNWAWTMLSLSNLRFPGQYFDGETRLNQNWNRDYDPATGRYVQSDPTGLMGGVNSYAYASGNPVNKIDAEGLQAMVLPVPVPAPGGSPAASDGVRAGDDLTRQYAPQYSPVPGIQISPLLSKLFSKSPLQRCEEDCEKTYDNEIDECRSYTAMTGDKYTFVACKKLADRHLAQCMADCDKNCN
jgi:RHS repeat-associated protein